MSGFMLNDETINKNNPIKKSGSLNLRLSAFRSFALLSSRPLIFGLVLVTMVINYQLYRWSFPYLCFFFLYFISLGEPIRSCGRHTCVRMWIKRTSRCIQKPLLTSYATRTGSIKSIGVSRTLHLWLQHKSFAFHNPSNRKRNQCIGSS